MSADAVPPSAQREAKRESTDEFISPRPSPFFQGLFRALMPVLLPALGVPGVLLLVGTVSYGEATTQGLVSVVAVLATLAPVVTVSLAVVLLGERLARRQQVGVVTALLGVVLLAAG